MIESILQVRQLAKKFGGLAAVDEVSLDVNVGQLHAVIGPNGAGKTTLINMLSGDLSPSAGSIRFGGTEVAHLSPERRSRLGIGRSYQKVNIFAAFSALENCRLAAQSRDPHPWNWLRQASSYDQIMANARSALADVGLTNRADTLAFTLSHGEQRQLEIAMSLATQPKLLLLDEPLAGLGIEESSSMVDLIRRMAEMHAILLVEHDMDAVFQLARVLTVMVDGRVLASGKPGDVRGDEQVQRAYLGKFDEHR
ncbi:MAG TPA: ABC transporter ATP-binding protein [Candidatus Binatia bacterium]